MRNLLALLGLLQAGKPGGTSREKQKRRKMAPDKDDAAYFALALKKNCGIWSNDKKLKDQDAVSVYSTHELAKMSRLNV